ncbi:hypothetical protein DFH07DRAFT_749661, partial [Mycena maculata]
LLILGISINGIAVAAARVITSHANLVIITGYRAERLKRSEEAIKKDVPAANIRLLSFDLTSLPGVRKDTAELNTSSEPLHVRMVGPFQLPVDNGVSQISTGHTSPFLYTKLIAPTLFASRLVTSLRYGI